MKQGGDSLWIVFGTKLDSNPNFAITLDQLVSIFETVFFLSKIGILILTLLTLLEHFPHARHQTHMGYKANTVIIHGLQITTLRLREVK